jgi:hypothetical protein
MSAVLTMQELLKRVDNDPAFIRNLPDADLDWLLTVFDIDPASCTGIVDELLGDAPHRESEALGDAEPPPADAVERTLERLSSPSSLTDEELDASLAALQIDVSVVTRTVEAELASSGHGNSVCPAVLSNSTPPDPLVGIWDCELREPFTLGPPDRFYQATLTREFGLCPGVPNRGQARWPDWQATVFNRHRGAVALYGPNSRLWSATHINSAPTNSPFRVRVCNTPAPVEAWQAGWAPLKPPSDLCQRAYGSDSQMVVLVGYHGALGATTGAGKTAILQQLTRQPHAPKKRILVLDGFGVEDCRRLTELSAVTVACEAAASSCDAIILVVGHANLVESVASEWSSEVTAQRTADALPTIEQYKRRLQSWLTQTPLKNEVPKQHMHDICRLLEQTRWTTNDWLHLVRYLWYTPKGEYDAALRRKTLNFHPLDGTAVSEVNCDPSCLKSAEIGCDFGQYFTARDKHMGIHLWHSPLGELTTALVDQ